MKYFCSKCGKTNLYSLEKPKFCGFCGIAIGAYNVKIAQNIELDEKKIENASIGTESFKLIKPKFKLDLRQPKSEILEDLVDLSETSQSIARPSRIIDSAEERTKEDILNEFRLESSASRKKENN